MRALRHKWFEAEMDLFFEQPGGPQPTQLGYLLLELVSPVSHWIAERICRHRGHRLVDTSYAGPECGSMGVYCTRCGESWSSILY